MIKLVDKIVQEIDTVNDAALLAGFQLAVYDWTREWDKVYETAGTVDDGSLDAAIDKAGSLRTEILRRMGTSRAPNSENRDVSDFLEKPRQKVDCE